MRRHRSKVNVEEVKKKNFKVKGYLKYRVGINVNDVEFNQLVYIQLGLKVYRKMKMGISQCICTIECMRQITHPEMEVEFCHLYTFAIYCSTVISDPLMQNTSSLHVLSITSTIATTFSFYKTVVPKLFGTRDWFCGKQIFHGLGVVGGMIQAHYIYCSLYFYYYYISSTSDH